MAEAAILVLDICTSVYKEIWASDYECFREEDGFVCHLTSFIPTSIICVVWYYNCINAVGWLIAFINKVDCAFLSNTILSLAYL